MSEKIIEIKNVVKQYKETVALDDVSLFFEKGKIYGLIGRNGSGKTVLLRCICGLTRVTCRRSLFTVSRDKFSRQPGPHLADSAHALTDSHCPGFH